MREHQFDKVEMSGRSVQAVSEGPFGTPQPARSSTLRPGARHPLLQLQRRYGNHHVQRMLALARQGEGEAEVTPDVESAIERARGGGQGLDSPTRLRMESAFGADFSGVRVHTGAEAHSLNRAVNAIAFTTGQDIFFRDGAYEPGTSAGRELLAHELTHVVQQGGATQISGQAQRMAIQRMCPACEEEALETRVQAKLTVSQSQDPDEVEAEQTAKMLASTMDRPSSETAIDAEQEAETVSSPLAVLAGGLQLASAERNPAVIEILQRSMDFVMTYPNHPMLAPEPNPSANRDSCSCGGRCPKCTAARSHQQATPQIGIQRTETSQQRIARQDGGGRSTWECVKWNLANAGVAGWTITIIGAVCGAVGAIIGLAGGPAAPATSPSGAAVAAAICLAGVAGLSVGFVLGIITGCLNDPSFQNITTPQAAVEGGSEGEGEEALA